jgi:hypothetical protein
MVSGFGSVSKDSRSTRRERLRFTVGPRGADAATPVADCRNWPELSRKPGSRRSVCGSITREQPRSRGGLRNGDISDVSHPTSGEKPSAADQRSRRLCLAQSPRFVCATASARSREVGVAPETLLTKAKQVGRRGVRRVDYALMRPRQRGYWSVTAVWLRLPRARRTRSRCNADRNPATASSRLAVAASGPGPPSACLSASGSTRGARSAA